MTSQGDRMADPECLAIAILKRHTWLDNIGANSYLVRFSVWLVVDRDSISHFMTV